MAGEQSGNITSFSTNQNTDISNSHVFPPTFYQIWHVSGDVFISPFPFSVVMAEKTTEFPRFFICLVYVQFVKAASGNFN